MDPPGLRSLPRRLQAGEKGRLCYKAAEWSELFSSILSCSDSVLEWASKPARTADAAILSEVLTASLQLINRGASVNHMALSRAGSSADGTSPLHACAAMRPGGDTAKEGFYETARVLMLAGGNPYQENLSGARHHTSRHCDHHAGCTRCLHCHSC